MIDPHPSELEKQRIRTALILQIAALINIATLMYTWAPAFGFYYFSNSNIWLMSRMASSIVIPLAAPILLFLFSFRVRRGRFGSVLAALVICVAMIAHLFFGLMISRVFIGRLSHSLMPQIWIVIYFASGFFTLRLYLNERLRSPAPAELEAADAARRRAGIGLLIAGALGIMLAIMAVAALIYLGAFRSRDLSVLIVGLPFVAGIGIIGGWCLICGAMFRRVANRSMTAAMVLTILVFLGAELIDRGITSGMFIRVSPTALCIALPTWIAAELMHARRQGDLIGARRSHGFEVQPNPTPAMRVETIQNDNDRLPK